MMTQKPLNVHVQEGEAFFSHEMSINFSPLQFVFDFRCVTPRIDIRDREKASLNIRHNVVLVDPFHAKKTLELLAKVVGDYEKKFGKIKRPKQLEKAEKDNAKRQVKPELKTTTPNYFG